MSKPKCNQCDSMVINGMYCHETGCPNTDKEWDQEDQVWYKPEEEYEDDDSYIYGDPDEEQEAFDREAGNIGISEDREDRIFKREQDDADKYDPSDRYGHYEDI